MSRALLIIDMQECFVPEIAGRRGLVERLTALRNSWRGTGAPVVVVR